MISIFSGQDNSDPRTQMVKTVRFKVMFVKKEESGHFNPPDLVKKIMGGIDKVFINEDDKLKEIDLKKLEIFRKCPMKVESDPKYKEKVYMTFKLPEDSTVTPIDIAIFRMALQEALNGKLN